MVSLTWKPDLVVNSQKAWEAMKAKQQQPDLSKTSYDALLFSLQLAAPKEAATLWGVVNSLADPIRSLANCGPWAVRHRVHRYQGHASSCTAVPVTSSASDSRDARTAGRAPAWLGRMFGRPRAD